MATRAVLSDLEPRLRAAGAAVASANDAYRAALEVRDELVVAAVDGGMSQRATARAAGLCLSRITSILLHAGG